MKLHFALASLASLAAFAGAQEECLSTALQVNPCATDCILSAATAVGCSFGDFNCQCAEASSSAIQLSAQSCVVGSCGIETALMVNSQAQLVCSCASSVAANSDAAATTTAGDGGGSSAAMTGSAAPTGAAPVGGVGAGSGGGAGLPVSASTDGGAAVVIGSFGGIMGAMLALIAAL